ncbi:MAG: PAS domain-containing protein [Spirochaetales bacterium]|nr:PAS domain-containing protein [Spirochaetales bacterium]
MKTTALDAIQDGVALLAPDMTILYANTWIQDHLGIHDVVGQKCFEGFQGSSRVCDFCPFGYVFKTGVQGEGVVPFTMRNKEIGWLSVSITPQKDEKGEITGYVEHLKDVTEQKITEAMFHFQIKIQRLLLEISSESVRIDESEIDGFLEQALGRLGRALGADRSYIFSFDYEGGVAKNTHEWCAPNIQAQKHNLQNLPLYEIEPAASLHRRGLPLFIPRVSEYEAQALRKILESQGIQSVLLVPLMVDEECIGSVGFDFVEKEHPKADTEYFFLEFFATLIINLNQRRSYMSTLRASEERLRLLADVTMEGIVIHSDGVATLANPSLCSLLGESEEGIVGKPLDRFFSSEELKKVRQKMELAYAKPYETLLTLADGTQKNVEIEARNFDFQGEIFRVAAIRDNSERIAHQSRIAALLEEKEVLLREVHHRIKNNMTTMMSLLSLQADLSENPEVSRSLLDAQARMQSMSVLYDKLYRGDSIESLSVFSYLTTLVSEILELYNRSDITVYAEIEDYPLPIEVLSPLGILTNEIISNSIKHAFIPGRSGTIEIKLGVQGNVVTYSLGDDGRGIDRNDKTAERRGFGSTLIQALTDQLQATLERTGPPGTHYTLRFPLAENTTAPLP